MPGSGPPPKPESQRRRRNTPTFEWTVLPRAGRQGPPPPLPEWRVWQEETRSWWADLWSTPQATVWDQSGRSLWSLAVLHHELLDDAFAEGPSRAASITAEMRQHEDRHGLSPKAMLQLRWRLEAEPVGERPTDGEPGERVPRTERVGRAKRPQSAKAQTAKLAERLKAV